MNKVSIFVILFLIAGAGFISFKMSYSFFSDSAASTSNTFAASTTFPTPTPSIADHLVINEVLYDTSSGQDISGQGGSNRGEFIEIHNPTALPVSVAGWTLSDGAELEALSGSIPAGGFLILTGADESEFEAVWSVPSSVVYVSANGGKIGNGFDNAGGKAILRNNINNIVDQISWGGDTAILNPAPLDVATGHSLEREPDGIDTDTAPDFIDRNPPTPGL